MRHLRYVPLLATSIAMGTEVIALRGPPANIRGLREQRSTMNHPSIIFEGTASPNSLAFHPPLASDQIRSILVARALVGLLNSPLSSILAKHSQSASIATESSISHNKTTHGSSNMELYLGSPGVAYPTGLLSEGSQRITSTITANGAEATDNAYSSMSTDMTPQGTEAMLGRLLTALRTLGALMLM
ncbi:hypothetical protein ANOM_002158 [Aspergillus nomiae NRRL 13137]|uniref:Uncharacterized protein n=1 Tax=Aspergillus nomiae NRRL (strain ATCC 15546 / NRRL 13137 / CBS 260.88 / M93) TaxID=1509407 RepID=A0A0L1JBW1_ASPN3|nr:uncharacterized protein ANOM_002158 [Aspergillus nomiae NRRL 13137]KNG89212.1 hypothetical protein ANOM_002158 [Aspergillus nomiae NRRL 13137]